MNRARRNRRRGRCGRAHGFGRMNHDRRLLRAHHGRGRERRRSRRSAAGWKPGASGGGEARTARGRQGVFLAHRLGARGHLAIDHGHVANALVGVVAGERARRRQVRNSRRLSSGGWNSRPTGVDQRGADGFRVGSWRRPVIHSASTLALLRDGVEPAALNVRQLLPSLRETRPS